LTDAARPRWLDEGLRHIWLPYTQMKTARPPLPVVAADGVRLKLADGRELIDGIASWWTVAHGYRHPHIEAAIRDQVARLPHVMLGGLAHEPAYRLAARLAAVLPGTLNRVFFSESGSVAVEIAMKMAVQYWLNRGERRTRFVAFLGGYHGDTFAAMSVCDPAEGMHRLFKGFLPQQHVVALPTDERTAAAFDALLAANAHEIAAILVEPLVQGAGGMRFHDAETLQAIRAACDRHGVLLICDEIFTGFGRTGALFACVAADFVPDIVTLGKALTGGTVPLAATVATDQVFETFLADDPSRALMHGPTYMGNALACAAANASLDLFEAEPRVERVAMIEAQLWHELAPAQTAPGVIDVRAMGAIGVIQFDRPVDAERLTKRFVDAGVWLRPFRDIIYTTPPLTIGMDDLSRITRAMVDGARAG
jgi:adenosylmethionine-8-amino-7-oxononanoate aminotransferase